MNIFLVRHGETDWNMQGKFQGREDIDLNENGIKQAKDCGQALKTDKFAAIITSPLIRAKKTAEIIADILSVKTILIEENIIERDLGRLSGLTPSERKAFHASGQDANVESFEKMSERMFHSIRKYADMYYPENILMVSHGASINSVLSQLSNGETGSGKIILKNTCISILEYDKKDIRLGWFNMLGEEYIARLASKTT